MKYSFHLKLQELKTPDFTSPSPHSQFLAIVWWLSHFSDSLKTYHVQKSYQTPFHPPYWRGIVSINGNRKCNILSFPSISSSLHSHTHVFRVMLLFAQINISTHHTQALSEIATQIVTNHFEAAAAAAL